MLKVEENETYQKSSIDLLVGGTPCQSFSTAGLRGGLADGRGNLALEFCRILIQKRPRWFVWENVPGIHSSFSHEEGSSRVDGKGRENGREFTETADFATIISAFRECGYSLSWRVLDAQFFGVPQRRRRVFVVGYLGDDWRPSAAVLFEPESLRRDYPPSRDKGTRVTGTIAKRPKGSIGGDEAASGQLIVGTIDASYGRLQGASGQDGGHGHSTLVTALTARPYADNESNESKLIISSLPGDHGTVDKDSRLWSIMPMNSSTDWKAREVEVAQPITTNHGISNNGGDIVQQIDPAYFESRVARNGRGGLDNIAAPLKAQSGQTGKGDGSPLILDRSVVRRLTPLECERLQGFPDGYTNIPGAADSPRYESIGNSMARPVMAWLGRRIDHYDKIFT